jgi:hypothetical protein
MLATATAFVVQRTVGSYFRYPRLYESQVELRKDSPVHHEALVRAAFEVLEQGPIVNLRGVTFPKLVDLLRHGTPVPIHGSQAMLFSVQVAEGSELAGQSVAEIFEQFPDLVAVAIIAGQKVTLPRGSTLLGVDDQLLMAAANSKSVTAVRRLASRRDQLQPKGGQ